MSKYMIEIEEEPYVRRGENALYRANGFNTLVFDQFGLDKLTPLDEELTKSYLEGRADQQKETAESVENLEQTYYKRGLDDAWECAKRISLVKTNEDCSYFSVSELKKIFGCSSLQSVFDTYSASEAIEKVKAYEEQQKADAEINVGDEVRNTLGLMDNAVGYVIGTTIEGDYNVSRYIDGKIKTGTWRRENCVKTGKHSDAIVQLLAEMEGSAE